MSEQEQVKKFPLFGDLYSTPEFLMLNSEERTKVLEENIGRFDKLIQTIEDYAKEKGYKITPYKETEEDRAEDKKLFNHFKGALTDLKIKNIQKAKDKLITKEDYLKKTYTIEETFKGLAEIEKEIEE